jgi:V/A-type H+-transporting ATPase subunit E
MAYRELIIHLRKEGEEKIRQLWSNAEKEAELIRTEARNKTEDIKSEYRKEHARTAVEQEGMVIFDAHKTAKGIRLSAEKMLAERLFSLVLPVLHEIRNEKYKNVFATLAGEIPESNWSEVNVSPEDAALAEQYFPDARIRTDSTITGGLEVLGNDGKIQVVNTFEKRLEKAWEDILPVLVKDIHQETEGYEPH